MLKSIVGLWHFGLSLFSPQNMISITKVHIFSGSRYKVSLQVFNKTRILRVSEEKGGERYAKHFGA